MLLHFLELLLFMQPTRARALELLLCRSRCAHTARKEQCTAMQALCSSMEVDSTAADECKESDGGALLLAADSGDGSDSAAPEQIQRGQQQISQ